MSEVEVKEKKKKKKKKSKSLTVRKNTELTGFASRVSSALERNSVSSEGSKFITVFHNKEGVRDMSSKEELNENTFVLNPMSLSTHLAFWAGATFTPGVKPNVTGHRLWFDGSEPLDPSHFGPNVATMNHKETIQAIVKGRDSGDEYILVMKNDSSVRSFRRFTDQIKEDLVTNMNDEGFEKLPVIQVTSYSYRTNHGSEINVPDFVLVDWVDSDDVMFETPIKPSSV